jgi:putative transposase
MGIEEVVTAPRSPRQNPFVERIIGSIRRECLNHVIIFDQHHLRRVLSSYFRYYHKSRTHLALDKDCPETRPIHPPTAGKIIAFPQARRSVVCIIATNDALRETQLGDRTRTPASQ